jgi:hypothetical protein
VIETVAKTSDTNVLVSGKNFPAGYNAVVTYQGVSATVTTYTATAVDADFSAVKGVPFSKLASAPTLVFKEKASKYYSIGSRNFKAADGDVKLLNAIPAAPTAKAISCSYAGGCNYEITGAGFAASLSNPANKITICGNPCVVSTAVGANTASKATCIVPALATTESIKNFSIIEPKMMALTWSGTGTVAEYKKLTNKNNMDSYTDSNAACEIKTTFKTDYKVVIDEISFFLNGLKTTADKDKIADKLKFQGSADGSAWTDLWSPSTEVHEGWNSKLWDGTVGKTKPAYNQIRFVGSAAGACRFGEIRLRGVEAKTAAGGAATDECEPALTIDGTEKKLAKVTYDKTKTPHVTSISPRFGAVSGSTTVTLVGTGFAADKTKNKVSFDNVPCVV